MGFTTFFISCGQESLVTCDESLPEDQQKANCIKKTPDEKAVIFLNEENYDGAISILETELDKDARAAIPPKYVRYVRLAAAYAGKANCSFLQLLEAFTGGNEGDFDCESGLTYSTANILTEIEKTVFLNRAISQIEEIPDELLIENSSGGEEFYAGSARLQSLLYIPAHTNKCLKLFAFVYESPADRRQFLNAERLSGTSCQPSQLADNLLTAAVYVISTLGCGESVSQEVCDGLQSQIREQSSEISTKSSLGDSDNEISNLMVGICEEQNPGLECPELEL